MPTTASFTSLTIATPFVVPSTIATSVAPIVTLLFEICICHGCQERCSFLANQWMVGVGLASAI